MTGYRVRCHFQREWDAPETGEHVCQAGEFEFGLIPESSDCSSAEAAVAWVRDRMLGFTPATDTFDLLGVDPVTVGVP